MDWFLGALKKYAVFEGRARRREYWFFVLFVRDHRGRPARSPTGSRARTAPRTAGLLSAALLARRPDPVARGRRAAAARHRPLGLVAADRAIPFIGAIVLIVFFVIDSQAGTTSTAPIPRASPARPA
jgi:hypothetical protein